MNRNLTVADILKKEPPEIRERDIQVSKLRKELGLVNMVYTGNKPKRKYNNPFSKYYKTLDDYEDDKDMAEMLIIQNKEIPADLYQRLKETAIEVKETYGYII